MTEDRSLFGEPPLSLFEAYGIELEYMIVSRADLAVRPIADELLAAFHPDGEPTDKDSGPVGWSNELVLHVIELKTNGPARHLAGWAGRFRDDLVAIDAMLRERGAMLLPGAMHPTMDPRRETVLWPHEYGEIYATYDRIFDCRRHGWANLQSCHVNLPFRGDAEFERLHAAIRAVLPLVPALAASSPVVEGAVTPALDHRLEVYCTHQARIPAAMGLVIPEVLRTEAEYERRIFAPLRAAAAELDPAGVLRPPFLNARGAIARFERGAIEIRLLDVQETPRADLAIALLVTTVVRALANERWVDLAALHALSTESLAAVLHRVFRDGERTLIDEPTLLAALGRSRPLAAGALWRTLRDELAGAFDDQQADWRELGPTADALLDRGPLARRLREALGASPDRARIDAVYRELGACLLGDRLFEPTARP
ncbi:MAG: glutamate--cysteine ligase [Planctomycetes bacterium]|nr:glutamate--cysteine ligase [Planctomycetota bacterium]